MLSKAQDWAKAKSLRDQCKMYKIENGALALANILEAKERLDRAAMGILNYYDRQIIGVKEESYPFDPYQYQLGLLFFGGQLFQDRQLPEGYHRYTEDFQRVFQLLTDAETRAVGSLS